MSESKLWDDPRVVRGMRAQLALRRERIAAGDKALGWKVGFGAPAMLEQLGIAGPLVGFLTQNARAQSGATVSLVGWSKPVAEPEIAVHIGRDLAAGADAATAAAAIAGISPAIELADVDAPPEDPERILAGNIYQRHVVLAGARPARVGSSADGLACRLIRHGREFAKTSDPQANTGETLVTIDGRPLPPSDHGLDSEGLVALPDGTFWVSAEYGPFLIHFDAKGKELERLSPFNGTLPRELSLRSPNQGMEGLTVTPDGSTLVGIMQSALATPGLEGSAKKVPLTRIVSVNLATKAMKEYLFPLANPQDTKVAVSEITALSDTEFLIDERDGELQPGANKKIYIADISKATDVGPNATVPGATYRADAGGLQVEGQPIETVVGVTTDAAAVDKLKSLGITVASKTLKLDLGALLTELNNKGEFFGHDKIEGLATPDGGKTLVIANDSDFGVAGITSDTPPFKLKPKTLANGRQDSGEFLVVDTTKLPAKTQSKTVSIKVG